MRIIGKIVFMFYLTCFITCAVIAQEVISTTGCSAETESVHLNFTIGEPISETFISTDCILNQGMHQVIYTITSLEETPESENEILLFPNPVTDVLTLCITNKADDNHLILYDLNGRILFETNVYQEETSFSMSAYVTGTYFLKVFTNDNEPKVFQIVKE